jgi:hypothetical protein
MRWKLVRGRLRAGNGTLFGKGWLVTHARLLAGLGDSVRALLRSERSP